MMEAHPPLTAATLARLLGPWRVVGGADAARHPARTALAERITALILDGRVAVGARLPAERPLSEALGLSRTTVTAAYAHLVEQGYAAARRGSGTYTALPERLLASPSGGWHESLDPDPIDLTCAAPLPPLAALRAATSWAAERLPLLAGDVLQPYGLASLREAVAERYRARGLPTEPSQILITAGAQGAITLVGRLLIRSGDRVLVEGPTYPNAIDSFAGARARLTPVPLDPASGWADVPGGRPQAAAVSALGGAGAGLATATSRIPLAQAATRLSPRLVYTVPHFHNPTGMLMPADLAGPLARAARKAGAWLLADETITDAALDVPVPPPFAAAVGAADAERLLVCGSLGKSFWGGLRIGWLRAPSRVVHELAAARASLDLGSPILDQLIGVAVLQEGFGIEEERRREWRECRALLETQLRASMPDWSWRTPEGGLSLWVRLAEGEESTALVHRAATHGLLLQSGPRFGADPGTYERHLRLPYTQTPDKIREAVRRLAAARTALGPLRTSESRRDLVA
ncbi:PLP-dependent aminotransferase family protein [Actinospica durhamensis]|nr:PLP-dependent aminotransferase family protein [Actinospica durhamensis]